MKQFEVIDISGDVGMRAFGATVEEAFINEAMGMYSLITDLEDIKEEKIISVSIESHSPEGLLVSWLNELVFQFDAYGFVGKTIMITEITPSLSPSANPPEAETLPPRWGGMGEVEAYKLKAEIKGGEFDPERHERKLLIKAATYHKLKIERINDRWEIDVIFDI